MRGFNILLVFLFGYFSCSGQQRANSQPSQDTAAGTYYGNQFVVDRLQEEHEVLKKYNTMATSDTLSLQFKTVVKEVCKVKGCWMIVELPDGEQAMVRFKDYGFFMPFDIVQKNVVLNGLAFVEEMSIEDQKHYAADARKSADELTKITTPRRTFSFEASGVLVTN